MRKTLLGTALLAVALLVGACNGEDDKNKDTGMQQDTAVADTGDDQDTGGADTGDEQDTGDDQDTGDEQDTGDQQDTGDEQDTGDQQDTGGDDTGMQDTSSQDTGSQDTGMADTSSGDTGGNPDGGTPAIEAGVDCSQVTAAKTVDVMNFEFKPDTVTIAPGEVVKWDVKISGHTITSGGNCTASGTFNATGLGSGDSYCVRYNKAGSYPYYCDPHCASGMTGTVTVQ